MSETHSEMEKTAISGIQEWRRDLLTQVMRALFLLAIPAVGLGMYYVARDNNLGFAPLYLGLFLVLALVRFGKRISYTVQVGTFLVLVYGLALLSVMRAGLASNVRLFLLTLPFIAAVFLGKRAGVIALALSMLTMLIFAALFASGQLDISPDVQIMSHKWDAWLSYTFNLLLASVFVLASLNYLLPRLGDALARSRDMARVLDAERAHAELDAERSRRQASEMQWVAAFGNALTALRQREQLVGRVVRDMVQDLSLYQVNLFLTDVRGETLSLAAASGELSTDALQGRGVFIVGERSLLGRVAQSGREQLVVMQTGTLPELPHSHAEIALPLAVRGELLGILDIHTEEETFSEHALQIFRIVAGYVSASLETLRLLEETETQIQDMRALYAQYTVASWRSLLEVQTQQSYTVGHVPEDAVRELVEQALDDFSPHSMFWDEDESYLLVVPLIARDVALGFLAFTRSARDWDQQTCALIESAAQRLALALDNTRLLVETRRQAFYQEQLGHLDEVVWGNPSVEAIMRQSVRELGHFLGASEARLYINPSVSDSPSSLDVHPLSSEE